MLATLAACAALSPAARAVVRPAVSGALGDDYPARWRNAPMDSTFDSWGEYNRECTSFVAWRLSSANGFTMPFHDNASGWTTDARDRGYAVNSTPAVGAVAASANHVAWVAAVGGGQVTVEEYNGTDSNHNGVIGDDGTYSTRTVGAGTFQYIHFKDLTGGVADPPPAPTPTDSDGDGVPDATDQCPRVPGVSYQQGCRQPMATFRGDFTGDGHQDKASFYVYPDRGNAVGLFIWPGNGDGTLQSPYLAWYNASGWEGGRLIPAGAADFDKDGRTDIAAFYRYDGNVVRTFVWFANADGSFGDPATETVDTGMDGTCLIPVGVGDYNGDGIPDIAALYRYPDRGNALAAVIWSGNPAGGLNSGQLAWYAGSGWGGHGITPVGSGDFNGDGRSDFAVFLDYGPGEVGIYTWFGTGDGTLASPTSEFFAGSGWTAQQLVPAGVGDFNGDGHQDIAAFYGYPDRGSAVGLFVWPGNGDGTLAGPALSWYTATGWWWLALIPAGPSDLNGDGRDEPSVFFDYGGGQTAMFTWSPDTSADSADPSVPWPATSGWTAANLRS
ncbi:FG-GAP-like repeat-containing protein [Streptomyces polygonati]|uniref:FG-GAP-like repeat-containing protein n=1 Tax=Streptomyces polygonati TaxID=1617087 RepID=A0ABV8HD54_9ACTN